jgi:hypothetical protein
MSKTNDLRKVILDSELERGVFEGGLYYIQTPRFDYLGKLTTVTAMSYVFEDVSIVFESGTFDELRKGKPKDAQKVSDRAVFDRAGAILLKMPDL